jgi:hypothetical protein
MISRWIRATALLALAPLTAFAFETVDLLRYPSSGAFPAWSADPARPWNVFAYGGLMYDSNPFRVPEGERSDMVGRFGAGGRMVTRVIGRQRVLLEGFGEYYDYQDFDEIDHFAYGARGEWLWEVGNDVNGVAGYSLNKYHADLGELRTLRRTMITTERWVVDGGYRFAANWRVFLGANGTHEEREHDDISGIHTNNAIGTLTYSTPLGNTVGLAVRGTQGDARVTETGGIASTADYDESEIALVVGYALGAQLRLTGRLGQTERTYDTLVGQDFDGTTYRGLVEWLPATKLTLSFEAFKILQSTLAVDATHVVREGASAGVAWAPTFKLVFSAQFVNENRTYQGDPGSALLGLPQRDDTLRFWRFAAGWEPLRHWQVGAGVDWGERDSNRLGQDYDYTQVMLNLRWTY